MTRFELKPEQLAEISEAIELPEMKQRFRTKLLPMKMVAANTERNEICAGPVYFQGDTLRLHRRVPSRLVGCKLGRQQPSPPERRRGAPVRHRRGSGRPPSGDLQRSDRSKGWRLTLGSVNEEIEVEGIPCLDRPCLSDGDIGNLTGPGRWR